MFCSSVNIVCFVIHVLYEAHRIYVTMMNFNLILWTQTINNFFSSSNRVCLAASIYQLITFSVSEFFLCMRTYRNANAWNVHSKESCQSQQHGDLKPKSDRVRPTRFILHMHLCKYYACVSYGEKFSISIVVSWLEVTHFSKTIIIYIYLIPMDCCHSRRWTMHIINYTLLNFNHLHCIDLICR